MFCSSIFSVLLCLCVCFFCDCFLFVSLFLRDSETRLMHWKTILSMIGSWPEFDQFFVLAEVHSNGNSQIVVDRSSVSLNKSVSKLLVFCCFLEVLAGFERSGRLVR